jgi:diguanylate cyclase (GGDEF)-like protein
VAAHRLTHPAPLVSTPGSRSSPAEARVARRRLALVQLATLVLGGLGGGLLATAVAIDSGPRLPQILGVAPGHLLVAFAMSYALAATLTIRMGLHVIRHVEDVLRHRRQETVRAASSVHISMVDLPPVLLDALTGLGNHRAFQEEVDRQLRHARGGEPITVGLIDLDDFRRINDTAGHAVGDEVLAEVSKIIRQTLRRGGQVFRVGGDEFGVIMPGIRAEDGAVMLQRALADCVQPRVGSPVPRGFSFSAGVTDAPGRGLDREDVLSQAEHALLEAKRGGRTNVRAFDMVQRGPLDEPAMRRASAAVVDVVRAGQLMPVYQPIVEVATGRVVGFEGLVRPTPGSGFEDPGTLFAVAEATGRTAELDRLCVETLIGGAGGLAPEQSLSLNLSPRTLEAPEFSAATLVRLVAGSGFDPRRVVLELTERQAITDLEALRRHLSACQAAGFRIAVDDVGAGNAGLRLLSQLHFDTVKIDLSLVQAGARREASLEVLRSLSELAARWGAKAVAEGVETASQLRMVRDLGLAEVQGYLLGAPSSSVDLRQVDLEALMVEPNLRAALGFTAVPVSPLG